MGENSTISWTDHTFNPWIGCTKVSPGCANCYAERDWDKRRHVAQWGPVGTRIVTSEENWKKPLRWNKHAEESGTRIKVFCASLADVFEDWPGQVRHYQGPKMWLMTQANGHNFSWGAGHVLDDPQSGRALKLSDIRHRLFTLIDQTPHLDWQLVTKRPENIRTMWPEFRVTPFDLYEEPLTYRKNVWLLTSVENQEQADKRIPELLKCRDLAPVLGLSSEPMLGAFDLGSWMHGEMECDACHGDGYYTMTKGVDFDCEECDGTGEVSANTCLDWVIAGGESGPGARPMHPNWVRSLRDQCQSAGVPFHFKQWGEWSPWEPGDPPLWWNASRTNAIDQNTLPDLTDHQEHNKWWWPADGADSDVIYHRVGTKNSGALLDGKEWREFPQPSC